MKNKLDDLVNSLFSQLERFDDDEFCKDEKALENELKKAHAVAEISGRILEVNRLQPCGSRQSGLLRLRHG